MSSNTVSFGDSDTTKTDAKISAKKLPGNQPRKTDRIKRGRETWLGSEKVHLLVQMSIVSVAFTVSAGG